MRKRNKRMTGVKGKGYKGLENYSLETAVKTIDILPALPYALFRRWQQQKHISNKNRNLKKKKAVTI